MKEYKKYLWILYTGLFLAASAWLFVHVSYLFRPVSVNRENIAGYYAEKRDSLDVVLIGGSSTYIFWAPYDAWNAEGIASYAFATNGMSPALLKGLMEEAEKTQSPKLFVIDLRALEIEDSYPDFYTDGGLRNVTDSLKYSPVRDKAIRYAFSVEHPEKTDLISEYLDLCMYHANWQSLGAENVKFWNNEVPNRWKGFLFVDYSFHEAFPREDYDDVAYEVPLSEKSDRVLQDLLTYCESIDTPVLFTLNPFYRQDETIRAKYNYVRRIVNDHGFPFLDTNDCYDEIGIDFSHDYYNDNHVNYYGAEKYTRFLAKYIKDHYDIPDRRGDSAYDLWNQEYAAWKAAADAQKERIDQAIAEE